MSMDEKRGHVHFKSIVFPRQDLWPADWKTDRHMNASEAGCILEGRRHGARLILLNAPHMKFHDDYIISAAFSGLQVLATIP